MDNSKTSNYQSFLDSVETLTASTNTNNSKNSINPKKVIKNLIGRSGKDKDGYQKLSALNEENFTDNDINPLLDSTENEEGHTLVENEAQIRDSTEINENPVGARYSYEAKENSILSSNKQQKQSLLENENNNNNEKIIYSMKQNKNDGYCDVIPDDSLCSLSELPKIYIPPVTPVSYEEFTSIIEEVKLAIIEGIQPRRIKQGSSGSYFCYNRKREIVGIFKPKNEEPYGSQNPKWTKWLQKNLFPCFFGRSCLIPNLGYISEAAASYVDRRLHLNIVPRTEIISLASPSFYYSAKVLQDYNEGRCQLPKKKGSFQIFMSGYKDANIFFKEGYDRMTESILNLNSPNQSISNESINTNSNSENSSTQGSNNIIQNEDLPDPHHPFKWNKQTQKEFQWQFERLVVLDYLIRNTDRGLDNWMIKYEKSNSEFSSSSQLLFNINDSSEINIFETDSNKKVNRNGNIYSSNNQELNENNINNNNNNNGIEKEKINNRNGKEQENIENIENSKIPRTENSDDIQTEIDEFLNENHTNHPNENSLNLKIDPFADPLQDLSISTSKNLSPLEIDPFNNDENILPTQYTPMTPSNISSIDVDPLLNNNNNDESTNQTLQTTSLYQQQQQQQPSIINTNKLSQINDSNEVVVDIFQQPQTQTQTQPQNTNNINNNELNTLINQQNNNQVIDQSTSLSINNNLITLQSEENIIDKQPSNIDEMTPIKNEKKLKEKESNNNSKEVINLGLLLNVNKENYSFIQPNNNELKDSNIKVSLRIAAIDNGLAFPYKHPDEWRSYPYGWSFLPISQIPFSQETRSLISMLTSNSWWIETFKGLEKLFRIDSNFDEEMWRNQKAVMRGQGYNLIEVLNRSVLNTIDGSPIGLIRRPAVLVYDEEETSDDEYEDFIDEVDRESKDWVALTVGSNGGAGASSSSVNHHHHHNNKKGKSQGNRMTKSVKRQYQKVKQQFVALTQNQPCFSCC